jgi:superfamily I DNA/RNA helicase
MDELIPEIKRDDKKDYLKVLEAIKELPFSVGKNLLIDFLYGSMKNKSIKNNKLQSLDSFGSLDKEKNEITSIIDNLIENKLLEVVQAKKNKFLKIIKITPLGNQELISPNFYNKKLSNNFKFSDTKITDNDRLIFKELDSFLNKYNDFQKKAIISDKEKILCIAGAGSGKTSVLTKRIEFLIKYKGIDPKKILAITFTRKAKEEMQNRLNNFGIITNIETFNSFCEKILKKYGMKIYGRPVNVITYGNKVMALSLALSSIGLTMDIAVNRYFSDTQKKYKEPQRLYNIFMNDCFFILDYFKSKGKELYDFSIDAPIKEKENAKMIYMICKFLDNHMRVQGLRDFTDQMLDTIKYFKEHNWAIPEFEHVLVDEYQDVNSTQIELLGLFNPKNLFVVGDPRQSIFGWRGSNINFILKFSENHKNSEIITLTKNYRSSKYIVELMNASIKDMKLPDIEYDIDSNKQIKILNFENDIEENEFIINKIIESGIKPAEIFVLARTNRQINELSSLMKQKGIKHIVKTDEVNNPQYSENDDITLATIHSIKGLEAKMVFVIGVNEQNFPCKAQDHPVIEMIKIDEYDREEEEKRLFYVAISRAKHILYLTYTGKKPTYFINDDMMNIINS